MIIFSQKTLSLANHDRKNNSYFQINCSHPEISHPRLNIFFIVLRQPFFSYQKQSMLHNVRDTFIYLFKIRGSGIVERQQCFPEVGKPN